MPLQCARDAPEKSYIQLYRRDRLNRAPMPGISPIPLAQFSTTEIGILQESRQRNCRRNTIETVAKSNRHEPIQISGRPNIKREMTMIKVGSKEEVALLLALFGVLDPPVQAPKRK